jgi:hypothetical protein
MKDIKGFCIHVETSYNLPVKKAMPVMPISMVLYPLLVSHPSLNGPECKVTLKNRVNSIQAREFTQVSSLGIKFM